MPSLVYGPIFKVWRATTALSVLKVLILTSLLVHPCGVTAYAGRIQRNKRDGMQSASSFCHAVVGLSWSYSRLEKGSNKKPDGTSFVRAANKIGLQLSGLYGKNAPKKYSNLFMDGWNIGMRNCYKSL